MQPEIIEEEIPTPDLPLSTAFNTEAPTTPEVPEIPNVEQPTPAAEITPDVPEIPDSVEITPDVPEIPQGNSVTEAAVSTPEVPDIPVTNSSASQNTTVPIEAPEPQHNGRIWPWPAKEAWDERQVYREVVAMLELIKTGKLTQTAQQLDNLGPHLDGNLDMLVHIGTIMRYLGREEHLQWMLKMAQITYPNDSNIAKAMAHLS
jgi:hypothetical protein